MGVDATLWSVPVLSRLLVTGRSGQGRPLRDSLPQAGAVHEKAWADRSALAPASEPPVTAAPQTRYRAARAFTRSASYSSPTGPVLRGNPYTHRIGAIETVNTIDRKVYQKSLETVF